MKNTVIITLMSVIIAFALIYWLDKPAQIQQTNADAALIETPPQTGTLNPLPRQEITAERYVFDVVLHKPEEITALLKRAQELAYTLPEGGDFPGVALVLHGPEIEFFAQKNYEQYKSIVDLAARLDANKVIDVKICRTMMGKLNLKPDDMPAFIEQVPYGPDEVERLKREGYTKL